MELLEHIGFWWLPSNPENQVTGIMKSSDEDGIYLEILGSFGTGKQLLEDSSHEVILGFTKEGKLLTLIEAVTINSTLPCPGIVSQKYRISLAFLGVHFNKIEEIKFFKLEVEYTYLSTWVYSELPDFLKECHQQYSEHQNFSYSKNIHRNNPVLEAKTTREKILIKPGIRWRSDNFLESSQIKFAQIIIDFVEREFTVTEFHLNYLYPLQNLLTLATNKNNFITKLTVFSRNGEKQSTTLESSEIPIQVISRIITQAKCKESSSVQMLFVLKDIETEFALYVQKWLNINAEIKQICDLYFGTEYAEFMYGKQRFLSTIQALESYHRVKFGNAQTSIEMHKNKLQEIFDQIPSQHLDWLKNKLHFSNEPSLKDRMKELFNKHKKIIEPFIKEPTKFFIRVGNTRNYFTHYDESLKDKFAGKEELFRLTQILSFLLKSCLLNELGCTPDRCAELISKGSEYQYTIEAVKQVNFLW